MNRLILPGTAPSVNHMYATTRYGKRVLKSGAKEWYNYVVEEAKLWTYLNKWSTTTEKVIVRLWFYFPDNRKRDTHNALKALLDALEDAGVYSNDRYALPHIMDWQVDKDNPRIEIEFKVVPDKTAAAEILSKAKRIPNYPEYYITQEGQVYSTRNSTNGYPKPIKTRSNGNVTLCQGASGSKQLLVKNILKQVWGVDADANQGKETQ